MTAAIYAGCALTLVFVIRLALVWRKSIRDQRNTDPLTGLPNRLGFEAIVARRIKLNRPFGIVFLDLDDFRKINELHGYSGGDLVLSQVGPRIRRCLRPGDAAARFGADQFLIMVRGHRAISGITAGMLAAINASAGVSLYPNHADNPADLMHFAELAARQAKVNARGCTLLYEPEMAAHGIRGSEIASLIRSALAHDNFRLVYQPIVDADGEIARMEALARIDDSALGRVAPAEFIRVAEQTGLILEVGGWILRRACRQARNWYETGFAVQVTVNMSPLQLASVALAERVIGEISACGLRTSAIVIHITGPVVSAAPVERLRKAGIHISTQQGAETTMQFDGLRMRAPFEAPAQSSGLTLVAQGIEEPEQLDLASAAGCRLFQGFLIAPPLEPTDATRILRTGLFADAGRLVNS